MSKLTKLSFAICVFVFLCSCESGDNGTRNSYGTNLGKVDYSRSESEIKEDLKTREKQNFYKYLSSDGTYRKNLLGEMVLEGTIENSATLASFKDIDLDIIGYSKTKSEVGRWRQTVYEILRPGRSKRFKIKLNLPRSVKSVGWDVSNAIPLK